MRGTWRFHSCTCVANAALNFQISASRALGNPASPLTSSYRTFLLPVISLWLAFDTASARTQPSTTRHCYLPTGFDVMRLGITRSHTVIAAATLLASGLFAELFVGHQDEHRFAQGLGPASFPPGAAAAALQRHKSQNGPGPAVIAGDSVDRWRTKSDRLILVQMILPC